MRSLLPALILCLLTSGCLEAASRTQRFPQNGGACVDEEQLVAGEPGDECVVAEDCSAYCCACAGGDFEAQLCLGGNCADAATTCDDAAANADLCR